MSRINRFWLLLILFSCREEKFKPACSPYTPPNTIDRYEYPLRPGMPEWAMLTSGEEMYRVCEVPDSILNRMSSLGVLETCLNYPLLPNVLAYTSLQKGTVAILTRFNGFQELGKRSEAAALLLNRYQQMGPACFTSAPESEQGGYAFTFTYVEMVVAQDEYLSKLSHAERLSLMRECLTKYVQKQEHIDIYGTFGLKTPVFVMARIMQFENYQPFQEAVSTDRYMQIFVKDVDIQGRKETLDAVVNYAEEFN